MLAAVPAGSRCAAVVELETPMDDGSVRRFNAWRCRHDLGFERSIGTIRIEPGLTPADTDREAFARVVQAGSLRLPYGGACGGIDADLRMLTAAEQARLARGFVQAFPDMATTGRSAFSGRLAGTLLSGWIDGSGRSLRLGGRGGLIPGSPGRRPSLWAPSP